MNILFFYINEIIPQAGGVENVTAFWYNFFSSIGDSVSIVFWKKHPRLLSSIEQTQLPNTKILNSRQNVLFIEDFILKNKIDIVINQIALTPRLSYVCNVACEKTKVRLVSVIHNTPDACIQTRPILRKVSRINWLSALVYYPWRVIELCLGHLGGRFQYRISEKVVVLSDGYIKPYCIVNADRDMSKVITIPNPLTLVTKAEKIEKENIVLFVGRLSEQKSVQRLLQVWSIIQKSKNENSWRLIIVGDGEERESLLSVVHAQKIPNVCFEGWKAPIEYYKKAKIFALTSEYEGLPMTLIECMHFGVVPIVYNSFSAARDIIDHGLTGFIVEPFDVPDYVNKLTAMMNNAEMLSSMSSACEIKSQDYSPLEVSKKWKEIVHK